MTKLDLTGYKLTFGDEFNSFSWNSNPSTAYRTATPNGTWSTEFWWGAGTRTLPANGELGYYSDSSVGANPFSVAKGALHITAAPSADTTKTAGQPYTSGVITTQGTFSQEYGYFEMRAKLPPGQGMWPCFWLLAEDGSWPPEIDVLEAFGSNPHAFHWATHTGPQNDGQGDWIDVLPNLTNSYHTYGVMWTADSLTYYFDGQAVASVATPADMHKPMYLVASLAVGGTWPGNPFPYTSFAAGLDIDYIRAYSNDTSAVAVTPQEVSAPDAGATTHAAAARGAVATASAAYTNTLPAGAVTGTAGNDLLPGGYGDIAARSGGSGDDTYQISDTQLPVIEKPGEGTDTVVTWVNYTAPPNVENIKVGATYGLHAYGNDLSNQVTGGQGDDWLDGNAGDDLLTGGGGNNTFFVTAGNGYDTITDFQSGAGVVHDRLVLDGYGLRDFAAVQAALRQSGDSTVLTLDNGETVTFAGVTVSGLTAANFAFTNVTASSSVISAPSLPAAQFGTPGSWGQDDRVHLGSMSFDGQDYSMFRATPAWGTVQGVQMAPANWAATDATHLAFDNFVQTNLDLHAAGKTGLDLLVAGAKGGSIQSGDGNDTLTWVAHSDASGAGNTMVIRTGGGTDTVHVIAAGLSPLAQPDAGNNGLLYNPKYTGKYSTAEVFTDGGPDTVTVEGMVSLVLHGGSGHVTAKGGDAADTFLVGTGGGDFTGGKGADLYVFGQGGGSSVIHDFASKQDHLMLTGTTWAQVKIKPATQDGVSGLLVTYDQAGDNVFLAHAKSLWKGDLVLA